MKSQKKTWKKCWSVQRIRPELYYKLKDIAVLYDGFFEYLEGKAITREEVLEVLGSVAGKSKKFKREHTGSGLAIPDLHRFSKMYWRRFCPSAKKCM